MSVALGTNVFGRRKFYWYLGGTLVTAVVVAHMFYEAWIGGAYPVLLEFTDVPIIPDGESGVEAMVSLAAGLYAAWLGLFINDWRKFHQGLILFLGTVLVVAILAILGIGIPNIAPTPANGLAFLLGLVVGFGTEGLQFGNEKYNGDLLKINFRESRFGKVVTHSEGPATFPIASRGLIGFVLVLVVVGNALEWAFHGVRFLAVLHAVGSLAFLYFFYLFIDIDTTPDPEPKRFEVLGPKLSGKTYFALALYATVVRNDQYELKDKGGSLEVILDEHNGDADRGERTRGLLDWSVSGTLPDEAVPIGFDFVTVQRLPRTVTVSMLDHGGELFADLAERLALENSDDDGEDEADVATDGGQSDETVESDAPEDDWNEPVSFEDGADASEDGASEDDASEDGASEGDASEDGASEDGASEDGASEGNASEDGASADDTSDEGTDLFDQASDGSASDLDPESESDSQPMSRSEGVEESDAGEEASETDREAESEATAWHGDTGTEDDDDDDSEADEESTGSTGDADSTPADVETLDDQEEIKDELVNRITIADKLVFLLDSQRFHPDGDSPIENDNGMQISDMELIAKHADAEEIVLVASKADYFIEEWQETTGIDNDPHDSKQLYDDFQDHVTDRFTQGDLQIGGLAATVNAHSIYPVYFVTGQDDDGNRKPKPDAYGRIQPVGYDRVLEVLTRDW